MQLSVRWEKSGTIESNRKKALKRKTIFKTFFNMSKEEKDSRLSMPGSSFLEEGRRIQRCVPGWRYSRTLTPLWTEGGINDMSQCFNGTLVGCFFWFLHQVWCHPNGNSNSDLVDKTELWFHFSAFYKLKNVCANYILGINMMSEYSAQVIQTRNRNVKRSWWLVHTSLSFLIPVALYLS